MPFDWGSLRERTLRVRTMMQTSWPVPPPDPLTEAELVEAEDQLGVVLPEEYRGFLLHVDSGGLGPVELRRLARGSGGWGWENDRETNLSALPDQFPDQTTFQQEWEGFCDAEPPVYGDARWRAWDEQGEELLQRQTSGAIYLGTEGHNLRLLLVVTGAQRGMVWFDRRVTSDVIVPLRNSNGTHATFLDLYTDWLQAAERLLADRRTVIRPREILSPIYERRFCD